MRWFATYFDHRYLARALTLHASLQRFAGPSTLLALCLDDAAFETLAALRLPGIVATARRDFEAADPAMAAAAANRSAVEYYFTCSSAWTRHVLRTHPEVDLLTYVDADLCAFQPLEPVYAELGAGHIHVTPHVFPPGQEWRVKYGRFNVGWLTFRNSEQGRACLERWREQSLEWCHDRLEGDRYADQKYLDEWPARYAGTVVSALRGLNVGPWGMHGARVGRDASGLTIDGEPLFVAHFHGLRTFGGGWFQPILGTEALTWSAIRHLYTPYARELRRLGPAVPALRGSVAALRPGALLSGRVQCEWCRPLSYLFWLRSRGVNRRLRAKEEPTCP